MVKYTAAVSLPFILAGIVLVKPLGYLLVGRRYAFAAPLAQAYLSYLILYLQVFAVGGIMIGT